jgi:hypothetical protein
MPSGLGDRLDTYWRYQLTREHWRVHHVRYQDALALET